MGDEAWGIPHDGHLDPPAVMPNVRLEGLGAHRCRETSAALLL